MEKWKSENWMGFIDSNKLISELTIPGTHDSATYNVDQGKGLGFVKTQTFNIEEQLNMGCRFLDIRGKHYKNNLVMHHGRYYLDLNFADILSVCKTFLAKNKEETILMSLKNEGDAESNTNTYEEAFMEYYNQDPSIWYIHNRIPPLEYVRGKIVLFRRFSLDKQEKQPKGSYERERELGINMDIRDNETSISSIRKGSGMETIRCEDLYSPLLFEEKRYAIKDNLNAAKADKNVFRLYITFTSGVKFGIYTPKMMAGEINPWLIRDINRENSGNLKIVVTDFIDPKLANHLIEDNFDMYIPMGKETDKGEWNNPYSVQFPFTIGTEVFFYANNLNSNYWFIQRLLPNGKMGEETHNGKWSNSYAVQFPFTIDGKAYFYAQNLRTNYWFIQGLLENGKMGKETAKGHWGNPYAVQFSFTVNHKVFFYAQNLDNHYWFIQELLTDGKMGEETHKGNWANSYSVQFPITIGGKVYLYAQNLSTNYWFTQELLSDGKMGKETANGKLDTGYAVQFPFTIGGRVFLYRQNLNTKYWLIQEFMSNGEMGEKINIGSWNESYDVQFPYELYGKVFFYGQNFNSKNWFIQELI